MVLCAAAAAAGDAKGGEGESNTVVRRSRMEGGLSKPTRWGRWATKSHTCMSGWVCAHVCVCACVCAHVCACMCACLCVRVFIG